MSICLQVIKEATDFLKTSGRSPTILVKIARNLGDSLHGQPIIRHYRKLYPNAAIVFLTEQNYTGAHEYNADINRLIALPNGLSPQTRLALWEPIKTSGIDITIIPAINPFRSVHKENDWCHVNIADQYLHNAGITNLQPLGGREIEVRIDDNDRVFADSFLKDANCSKMIALEYISYSSPPTWTIAKYTEFVKLASTRGYKCISIAGRNEPLIQGTLDLRGASWRQTVAVLGRIRTIIGCGSGITMLASASRPQPTIIEVGIPDNVTIIGCGYAKSIPLKTPTPNDVLNCVEKCSNSGS